MGGEPSRASPSEPSRRRVLILGGSTEASELASALAARDDLQATLSLAGRVEVPAPQPVPTRVGGFGGAEGLAAYLRAAGIDLLIDATHPFAARMSAHARAASAAAGVPLLVCGRAPWRPETGDRWREVDDMAGAAAALGVAPRRVFLTIGRLHLTAFAAASQHDYLVRSIDPVGPDHGLRRARFITARGPFAVADEAALMRSRAIEVLVTKNSGGTASHAKIVAARALGIEVVLVRQPGGHGDRLGVADTVARVVGPG